MWRQRERERGRDRDRHRERETDRESVRQTGRQREEIASIDQVLAISPAQFYSSWGKCM